MDRAIAPEILRRRRLRIALTVALAVAAIVFTFAATLQWLRPSVRRRDLEIARVERGTVDATIPASGTVVAAVEQVISSPVEARMLRVLRRAGDHVHAGDELVELDTSATRLDVDRLAGQVAQKRADLDRLRLQLEDAQASQKATLEQKQLDAEIVRFKAEQNARLHREGLIAAQEDLSASTAAKKATIEIAQLREAMVRSERSGQNQLQSAYASLRTAEQEWKESQRQLQLAMMRADRDGVVTWIAQDPGATVRRGDIVARIADLSSYRIDATISDLHAARLSVGMRVRVRIDDKTTIGGTIAAIDPGVEGGVLKFHVALDDPSMSRLRSNARLDLYVITGHRAGVLRVRRGALAQSEREEVFVVRDDRLVAVPVRWGLAGEEYVQPLQGLREGDDVVISNMSDSAGMRTLRLK